MNKIKAIVDKFFENLIATHGTDVKLTNASLLRPGYYMEIVTEDEMAELVTDYKVKIAYWCVNFRDNDTTITYKVIDESAQNLVEKMKFTYNNETDFDLIKRKLTILLNKIETNGKQLI